MILEWLLFHFPGHLQEDEKSVFIRHENGDTSSFWKWDSANPTAHQPPCLDDCFSKFEAADLLSSTFKISSPIREFKRNNVGLIYSQSDLVQLSNAEKVVFPSGSIPFMIQAGDWLYAYSAEHNTIWEWDLEYPSECKEYKHLLDIFNEWRENAGDESV